MKRLHECEDCKEKKKEKYMFKIHEHWICSRCYRKATSFKAINKANKEAKVWKARKFKKPFTSQEEHVLWKLYEKKHISYSEMEQRMKELKSSVMKNNAINWIKEKANKPSFQEEFRKLKERK